MNNNNSTAFVPIALISLCLFLLSGALLFPAMALSRGARLLPVAMLVAMMVLSVLLVLSELKKSRTGQAAANSKVDSPSRVIGALAAIFLYMVAVNVLGFYVSTPVFLPVCAYFFGCRSIKVLLAADIIIVTLIYLVFDVLMSKGFPTGFIW